MNITYALQKVYALVKNGWCQKNYAEDAKGHRVSPISLNACNFCITGAIYRVDCKELNAYLQRECYNHIDLIRFNDSHTHEEVLEYLQTLILRSQ